MKGKPYKILIAGGGEAIKEVCKDALSAVLSTYEINNFIYEKINGYKSGYKPRFIGVNLLNPKRKFETPIFETCHNALMFYGGLKEEDKEKVRLVIAWPAGDGLELIENLRKLGYKGHMILGGYEQFEDGESVGFDSEGGLITHDKIKEMGIDGVVKLPASKEEFSGAIKNYFIYKFPSRLSPASRIL